MCSRYQIDSNIIDDFPNIKGFNSWQNREARDIRPTDIAPVIMGKGGELYLQEQVWGFKSAYDGKLLINARAETVLDKKTFSDSAHNKRIVIPASLFYEWDSDKQKVSFFKETKKKLCIWPDCSGMNLTAEGLPLLPQLPTIP